MSKTVIFGLSILMLLLCPSLPDKMVGNTSAQPPRKPGHQFRVRAPQIKRFLNGARTRVDAARGHFSNAARSGAKAAGKAVGVFVLPPIMAASAAGSVVVPFGQFFTVPTAVMAVYTPFVLTGLAAQDGAHAVGELAQGVKTLAFGSSAKASAPTPKK